MAKIRNKARTRGNSKKTGLRAWLSKLAFSKQMCVVSWVLMAWAVFFSLVGEFLLQWTGRGSMLNVVQITLAVVTVFTAFINGGYLAQNVIRDTNLNAYGIHIPTAGDKHYIEPVPAPEPSVSEDAQSTI